MEKDEKEALLFRTDLDNAIGSICNVSFSLSVFIFGIVFAINTYVGQNGIVLLELFCAVYTGLNLRREMAKTHPLFSEESIDCIKSEDIKKFSMQIKTF